MEVMYGSPYRHLLPYSLRNGSMVMAKKIVFEIIADSDSTTLKTDVYKRQVYIMNSKGLSLQYTVVNICAQQNEYVDFKIQPVIQ